MDPASPVGGSNAAKNRCVYATGTKDVSNGRRHEITKPMGYIAHESIVVTGFQKKNVVSALKQARLLGLPCSGIVASPINGYLSFLIAPDGSKEGWEESVKGEEARKAWAEHIKAKKIWVDWVHIRYGGDEAHLASIADHNGKGDDE